jgi:hypothetical protein
MTRLDLTKKKLEKDNYIPQVWNLYRNFLTDILEAENTSPIQKQAALQLLNMISCIQLGSKLTPEESKPECQ